MTTRTPAWRRAAVRAAQLIGALALAVSTARAADNGPPLRVVPADDAALASLVLLAAGVDGPVLVFDPQDAVVLARWRSERTGPVECFARTVTPAAVRAQLEEAVGAPCTAVDDLTAFARRWWPEPGAVVAAPADQYPALLQGASLAAALGGALLPVEPGAPPDAAALAPWASARWFAVGASAPVLAVGADVSVETLTTPAAVRAAALAALGEKPRTIVVANPADRRGRFSPSSLSLFAPLIAARHRAPLVLVSGAAAARVEREVEAAITAGGLAPTHIYLVGDELALRSHRVPDPVLAEGGPEALGGARDVRVELFSNLQRGEPQAYAVGRFVAEDAARASAMLAAALDGAAERRGRIAVLSNADEVFALGETISRTTVAELKNAALPVRAAFRGGVTPAVIRDALQKSTLLVWEGHARDLTLEERGGIAVTRTPPLVVLQGCYTLDRSDPFIFFEHGTQAIVATSAAIYSASGSSFARAFFDALVYSGADLGTAVRDARNYLFALVALKKQRGYRDWTKTLRAALAFALWGDPTLQPPLAATTTAVPPATWRIAEDTLQLTVPGRRLETVGAGRYTAQPVSRAMLGGLILPPADGDGPQRVVKELFYTAIAAPDGVTTACPSPPGWEVVSLFAPATDTLFVLARPPGDTAGDPVPVGTFSFPLGSTCEQPPPMATDDHGGAQEAP